MYNQISNQMAFILKKKSQNTLFKDVCLVHKWLTKPKLQKQNIFLRKYLA